MRALRLLAVAAEAEGIRLKRSAQGAARAAVFFAAAAVFGIALLVMLHVAAYNWLEPAWGPALAALFVAGADLLLALVLFLVGRPKHDPVAEEALALRRASLAEATEHPFRGLLSWGGGGASSAAPTGGAAHSPLAQIIAERAIRSVLRR